MSDLTPQQISSLLREQADAGNALFVAKLVPNVDSSTIIGVRSPNMKRLARMVKEGAENFLNQLPHELFDEYLLHANIINLQKDYEEALTQTQKLLPYIDNWAVCDTLNPTVLATRLEELHGYTSKWLASQHVYTMRFGIGMLMRYYLEENYIDQVLDEVACVKLDDYYVQMMQAWFFATALAKQWKASLRVLDGRLPLWVHRKTIQKACESNRITQEQKLYLRTLRDVR